MYLQIVHAAHARVQLVRDRFGPLGTLGESARGEGKVAVVRHANRFGVAVAFHLMVEEKGSVWSIAEEANECEAAHVEKKTHTHTHFQLSQQLEYSHASNI